jgi:hypothetical protein
MAHTSKMATIGFLLFAIGLEPDASADPSGPGCCSSHGGVAGCNDEVVVCRDGTPSPTCQCDNPRQRRVIWTLTVNDGVLERTELVKREGAQLRGPVGWQCEQKAPERLPGRAMEIVDIGCRNALGAEVRAAIACATDAVESQRTMLFVKDSVGSATFGLACVSR